MVGSLSILFAILIVVPGLLIPLLVCSRMYKVLSDGQRHASERIFAGGTMIAMFLLMAFAVYAAQQTFLLLNDLLT